ncbi:MAG: Xaa-Pro peptidase family protein [Desulfobacteraceae bacterium]|nr:Xaa-Pro peptidase family protein [Desulfobacteraceae bacterium]
MESFKLSTPRNELYKRIEKFQLRLKEKEVDAALISYKTDLFYFSGTIQQGWLYIPAEGAPLFMVFKDFPRAKQESGLDTIIPLKGPQYIPETLKEHGYTIPDTGASPATIGVEFDVLPVNQLNIYKRAFPKTEFIDVSVDIRLTRAVKSEYEINIIRRCAGKWDKMMEKAPDYIEEGVSEVAAAGKLEGYARTLGHQGFIRMRIWTGELLYGHFMSGSSASLPSHLASATGGPGTCAASAQGAGFKKIEKNEPILIDYAFGVDGYLIDNTRIFSIGRLSDEFLKAHDTMLEAQEIARKIALPGTPCEDIYFAMLKHVENAGYKDYFMGAGEPRIKFTGHGIGLEIDEFPFIAQGHKLTLEKNMVIAMEPKIVIPGKGVVGIENTHLVTETGLESLASFPDEIAVI